MIECVYIDFTKEGGPEITVEVSRRCGCAEKAQLLMHSHGDRGELEFKIECKNCGWTEAARTVPGKPYNLRDRSKLDKALKE